MHTELKLDILAIGIHPDDVELSCGGTVAKHQALGYKTGILDLSQGEMGTRGNAVIRIEEAKRAAEILQVDTRINLGFEDVWCNADKEHQLSIIEIIRLYKPNIVLINAPHDRHPDHAKGAKLTTDACFNAGLPKIVTSYQNNNQEAWRPAAVYHYVQGRYIDPDFVVDISEHFETKMKAIQAFKTQFFDPNGEAPNTYISDPQFLEYIRSRDLMWGKTIGVKFAEGFIKQRYVGVSDLTKLI